jgi:hypothetical protein
VPDDQIDQILVRNPRDFFAQQAMPAGRRVTGRRVTGPGPR